MNGEISYDNPDDVHYINPLPDDKQSSPFSQEDILQLKTIFKSKFPVAYPNFSQFLDAVNDHFGIVELKSDDKSKKKKPITFVAKHRLELAKFYYSQDIVQVFKPPPKDRSIASDPIYYPKIIAFYPFERVYSDTGFIRLFNKTRKKQVQIDKEVLPPKDDAPAVVAPAVVAPSEYPIVKYKGYTIAVYQNRGTPTLEIRKFPKGFGPREKSLKTTSYEDALKILKETIDKKP